MNWSALARTGLALAAISLMAVGEASAQLYNVDADLGEANNLYMKHPEIVHRLKAGLEKIKTDENYNPTALEQPKRNSRSSNGMRYLRRRKIHSQIVGELTMPRRNTW